MTTAVTLAGFALYAEVLDDHPQVAGSAVFRKSVGGPA